MNVLDSADVEALIDEDAGLKRLRVKPTDEVPAGRVRAEIDGLVGIHQQHIADGAVVSFAANAPGIRDDVGGLLGIENDDAANRAAAVEGDEGLAVGIIFAGGGEQARAFFIGGFRCGESSFERDAGRNIEIAFDAIIARGDEDAR